MFILCRGPISICSEEEVEEEAEVEGEKLFFSPFESFTGASIS